MNLQKPLLRAAKEDLDAMVLRYQSELRTVQSDLKARTVHSFMDLARVYGEAASSQESAEEVTALIVSTLLDQIAGGDACTLVTLCVRGSILSTFKEYSDVSQPV